MIDLPLQINPFLPALPRPFTSSAPILNPNPYWDLQITTDHQAVHNVEFLPASTQILPQINEYRLQKQIQFLSLQDQLDSVNHVQANFSSISYFKDSAVGPRSNRSSPRLPEVPVKVCHYFNKGFCKHGSNCRYFHGHIYGARKLLSFS